MKKSGEKSIMKTFENFAQSLQAAIGAQFFERYGDVQAFALNPAFLSMERNEIVPFLDQYVALYGIYDLILVVDTKGHLIAVNSKDPKGNNLQVDALYSKNFATQDWFQNTLTGKFSEDKDAGFVGSYVEDVHFDSIVEEAYSKESFGNSFNAQIKNEKGQVIGVVSNRASSRWWEGEFTNLYQSLKKAGIDKTELTMLDKNGNIILDFDPVKTGEESKVINDRSILGKVNLVSLGVKAAQELQSGKSGANVSVHARKKIEQIAGYSPVSDKKFLQSMGWGVLVRNVATNAFSALNKTWLIYWLAATGVFVFAIGLSYLFANKLSHSLNAISSSLYSTSSETTAASQQLSGMGQALSSGASESSTSLESTVSAIEELSSMVARNNESAKEASLLSRQGAEKAKAGELEMLRLQTAVKEISESSKKIEEIINVIDDIAFQTNLLALNAAVEAARAGEQGRGFAVVAGAVRSLAQRSSDAAKDISQMIRESVSKVQIGMKSAEQSAAFLGEIVVRVNKINELNQEISVASDEQSKGISQISQSLNELSDAVQKNASSAEESAATAEELSSQANELQNLSSVLQKEISGSAGGSTGAGHQGGIYNTTQNFKKAA
jgi:methyl-accepting chemotaxis protein